MINFTDTLKQSIHYIDRIQKRNIDTSFPDVEKGALNFDDYLNELMKFSKTLPENYESIYNQKDIVMDAIDIFTYIFGDLVDKDFVANIVFSIHNLNTKDPFYAALVEATDKATREDENILLFGNLNSLLSIPTFNHEVMHYMLLNKSVVDNLHISETLSILIELITAEEVMKLYQQSKINVYDITLLQRIDNCKSLESLRRECSDLAICTEFEMIKYFTKHVSFEYNYSFIVAYNLYLRYLENKASFLRDLRKLIETNSSLTSYISKYEISLEDKKTTDNVINLMRSL